MMDEQECKKRMRFILAEKLSHEILHIAYGWDTKLGINDKKSKESQLWQDVYLAVNKLEVHYESYFRIANRKRDSKGRFV